MEKKPKRSRLPLAWESSATDSIRSVLYPSVWLLLYLSTLPHWIFKVCINQLEHPLLRVCCVRSTYEDDREIYSWVISTTKDKSVQRNLPDCLSPPPKAQDRCLRHSNHYWNWIYLLDGQVSPPVLITPWIQAPVAALLRHKIHLIYSSILPRSKAITETEIKIESLS